MFAADTWTTIGSGASVVAAIAALMAVRYARETVRESRAGRTDARRDHAESLREQRALLDAAHRGHEDEMAEREKALARELALQRIVQLDRVGRALIRLTEVARAEAITPPPALDPVQPIRLSAIPSVVAQLRMALRLFNRLGGPALNAAERLAEAGPHAGTPATSVLGDAFGALSEVEQIARNDESLEVELGD
jgi:hypothetical protein